MTMTSIERFERCTVILPQKGPKLGLILSPTLKSPSHPTISETLSKPQCHDDSTDDKATMNEPNENPEKRRLRSDSNDGENYSASKKQRTQKYVFVRAESPALELAGYIRQKFNVDVCLDDDATINDCSVELPSIEWRSLDDLINFAMKKLRREEKYNREILKFALVNGIKGGDMLHCIQTPTELIYAKDMDSEPIKILSQIFSDEANYPLHLTLKRNVVKQFVKSTTYEVICLQDSDSEPDEPHSNVQNPRHHNPTTTTDDASELSDNYAAEGRTIASDTLRVILNKIAIAKAQLLIPPQGDSASSIKEHLANQIETAQLIEKLARAAVAIRNMDD